MIILGLLVLTVSYTCFSFIGFVEKLAVLNIMSVVFSETETSFRNRSESWWTKQLFVWRKLFRVVMYKLISFPVQVQTVDHQFLYMYTHMSKLIVVLWIQHPTHTVRVTRVYLLFCVWRGSMCSFLRVKRTRTGEPDPDLCFGVMYRALCYVVRWRNLIDGYGWMRICAGCSRAKVERHSEPIWLCTRLENLYKSKAG